MNNQEFKLQLEQILAGGELKAHFQESLKSSLMQQIQVKAALKQERSLLTALRSFYRPVSELQKESIKSQLMAAIEASPNQQPRFVFQFPLLFRRSLSVATALTLSLIMVISPLMLLPAGEFVSVTHASALLQCDGSVTLNGVSCVANELRSLSPGDSIVTAAQGSATIFYDSVTLVRIDSATSASIDASQKSGILLSSGSVWVHAPTHLGQEAVSVETPLVKASVPQGDAGIRADSNLTRLVASTAAVEVEVQKTQALTELVTLPPDKKLIVRQSKLSTQVRQAPIDEKSQQWVLEHQRRDEQQVSAMMTSSVSAQLGLLKPAPKASVSLGASPQAKNDIPSGIPLMSVVGEANKEDNTL